MLLYRRALGVCLCVLLATTARAFTFSYGKFLDVKDVHNTGGVLQLPLTNKKYTNVRVLSKKVYDFLQQCTADCVYPATEVQFDCSDHRRAENNRHMLIATIMLNGDIQLTVLAFKNKHGISVKFPETVQFADDKLLGQLRQYVTQLAQETL